MIEVSRRKLITGLVAFVAAPAIVRASSLMPVKAETPVTIWIPPEVRPECHEVTWHKKFLVRINSDGDFYWKEITDWQPTRLIIEHSQTSG